MPAFERCPCAGGTLDKLMRPAILSVLTAGPMHGYRLVERLAELRVSRGRKPDPTGIYRALRSMQKMKLVSARWDVSGPGPAKHLYRLSPAGRACLRRWTETLQEYRQAVDELLRNARTACRCAGRRRGPARERRTSRGGMKS